VMAVEGWLIVESRLSRVRNNILCMITSLPEIVFGFVAIPSWIIHSLEYGHVLNREKRCR
jgi:hypothetical protein